MRRRRPNDIGTGKSTARHVTDRRPADVRSVHRGKPDLGTKSNLGTEPKLGTEPNLGTYHCSDHRVKPDFGSEPKLGTD